jgi:phage baseplate assembly protein gpV
VTAALYESVARIARHEAGARATSGIGKVVDLFPAGGALKDHAVSVEMISTGLVLPKCPVAVGCMGFAAIPAVDDLVLVVFMDGDSNAGVVAGRIYHPDLEPPQHDRDQIVLALPAGSDPPDLSLFIKSTEPSVELKLPGDVTIAIEQGKVTITVDQINFTLDSAGSGRAELAAGGSKLTLKQDGDITLESAGKLVLKGTEVEIEGSAKVKVQGSVVEVN